LPLLLLQVSEQKALVPLDFDPVAHAGFIDELKLLYVAVTRAKSNLIIFESDPYKRAPFYYYLRRLGLAVAVKASLAFDEASTLLQHTSNTPADWAERAGLLLQQKLWDLAAKCYNQAGDWLREAATKAKALIEAVMAPEKAPAGRREALKTGEGRRAALEEAAVLLMEAAAAAAQRQQAAAAALVGGKSRGSSSGGGGAGSSDIGRSVSPPVTFEEWQEWLSTAAAVMSQGLKRHAEAVGLYCQVRRKCGTHVEMVVWLQEELLIAL
jgi:hypothetical protein